MTDSANSKRAIIAVWCMVMLFFPLTMSLGFWQLDRAEQKIGIQEEQSKQVQAPTKRVISSSEAPSRFQSYRLEGRYIEKHFLLDNRQRSGKVGYELLTPFELQSGGVILVNRGWLKAGRTRDELPELATPKDAVEIEGFFYWSDKPIPVLDNGFEMLSPTMQRIQSIDWPRVQGALNNGLVQELEFRLMKTDEPGALDISWVYQSMKPEKHQGYAFQWFSMAVALIVLAIWATYRLKSPLGANQKLDNNNE